MQTSLIINSKSNTGKSVSKSLTRINENVSNEDLKQAAQLFTDISKGSYVESFRVNKVSLDEESE